MRKKNYKTIKTPPLKYLFELFELDCLTGDLYWKVARKGLRKGSKAGCLTPDGYIQVMIDKVAYKLHRIIYKMFVGKLSIHKQIDHDDGNKINNRPDNLFQVTHKQNGKNQRISKNNTSGYTGVSKYSKNKWISHIKINGKRKKLGVFSNKEQAIKIRQEAERKYKFHKNHGKLIQLMQKDIKPLKEKLHKQQKYVCPILNQKFVSEKMVLDHRHMTKAETIGVNGAGLIRGAIHGQANVIEGKLTNAYKRYGLAKFDITLPDFLRNLADYLERDNLPYIHPNEKPPVAKLMKRSYNKLVTLHKKNLAKPKPYGTGNAPKMIDFPKSGKLTKPLEKLYKFYGVEPEYYGAK